MNATVKWVLIGVGVAVLTGFVIGFAEGAIGADFGLLTPLAAAFAGALTGYIGLNLSGNRKTETVSNWDKHVALALEPAAGQALLVIYREGLAGSMAGMNISVDGREVAQLRSPQFTVVPLSAGAHDLQAAFGGLAGPQNNPSRLTVQAAPGQVLAVRAVIGMGLIKNTIQLELDASDLPVLRQRLAAMRMIAPA